jgi:hypothetical protein
MTNATSSPISSQVWNHIQNTVLGMTPGMIATMKTEAPQLQAEMDRKVNLKHTPLTFLPNKSNPIAIMLRRVPVFIVAVKASTGTFSHLFSCFGRPGQGGEAGRKSGIEYTRTKEGLRGGGNQYFATSGDGDRGETIVKEILTDLAQREKVNKMPADLLKLPDGGKAALATIKEMDGLAFLDHTDFYAAYMERRLTAEGYPPDSDKTLPDHLRDTLNVEYNMLNGLVPKDRWELWNREPRGLEAKIKHLPDRDIELYENDKGLNNLSDKELFDGNTHKTADMNLRRVDVDPLKFIEKKREYMLQRMFRDQYVNEKTVGGKFVPLELLKRFMASIGLYKLTSPLANNRGNCASGTTQWYRDVGVPEDQLLAPSNYAFGFHNRLKTWDPLWKNKPEPVKVQPKNPDIDTRSFRNGRINIEKLNAHLLVHARDIELMRRAEIMAKLAEEQAAPLTEMDESRSKL